MPATMPEWMQARIVRLDEDDVLLGQEIVQNGNYADVEALGLGPWKTVRP